MSSDRKKIKIGILTERMLRGFGVDLVVHKTAEFLANQGYKVTVFCLREDRTFNCDKYNIITIPLGLSKNPLITEWNTLKFLKRLDKEDIDLWIAETFPFYTASLVMNQPVISVNHGVSSSLGFPLAKKLSFFYYKITQKYIYFPKSDKVINISQFIQSLNSLLITKKQEIIYNGVDHYVKSPADVIKKIKEKYNIDDNDIILLYVGRLNNKDQPYKGTAELIEIFHRLRKQNKNIKLIMAGFGNNNDKKWLKNNKVIPIISASNKTIAALYSMADIYVSASKWEGFNLPAVEASYFSTPCVLYNIGAHKEVTKDRESGFLVGNKDDFIEKTQELINNRKLREEMSVKAKENANHFTWKKSGKKYLEIINNLDARPKENKYKKGLVDIIILNYNGKEFLDELFETIQKQTYKNIKTTVVDNNSSDGSQDYIEEKYPWVNLIKSPKNLFFSRGNNLAVSKTNGEYILFLNNDIRLEPNAIQEILRTLERKGKYGTGAIAAKMLFYTNRQVIDSIGTVITNNGAPFNRGIGQLDIGQYDTEEEIFGACFGTVLVRRVVYKNIIGPLDNSYFGYFEDVDWSYRTRIFGYKTYACSKAIAYHHHSGTTISDLLI